MSFLKPLFQREKVSPRWSALNRRARRPWPAKFATGRRRMSRCRALVAAGLVVVLMVLRLGGQEELPPVRSFTVTTGLVVKSLQADGVLLAERRIDLSFPVVGQVAEVYVSVGQHVQAGDALLRQNDAALQLDLDAAALNVELEQAELQALARPPMEEALAAAAAARAAAEARLAEAERGGLPEELLVAQAELQAAEAELAIANAQLAQAQSPATEIGLRNAQAEQAEAEADLKRVEIDCTRNPAPENTDCHLALAAAQERVNAAAARLQAARRPVGLGLLEQAQAVQRSAVARRDAAAAKVDRLQGPGSVAEIEAAREQALLASHTEDRLQQGPTAEEITIAEAELTQAELRLEQARAALQAATLRAPFDGVINAIYVHEGEAVGSVAVQIIAPETLEAILFVDEGDIGQIDVGQEVQLTVLARPGESFKGRIIGLDPAPVAGVAQSAGARYRAYLDLTFDGVDMQPGMAIGGTIVLERQVAVLRLPNEALLVDRATGRYSVYRLIEGVVQEQPVEVGLVGDEYSAIVAGLEAGQQVAERPLDE